MRRLVRSRPFGQLACFVCLAFVLALTIGCTDGANAGSPVGPSGTTSNLPISINTVIPQSGGTLMPGSTGTIQATVSLQCPSPANLLVLFIVRSDGTKKFDSSKNCATSERHDTLVGGERFYGDAMTFGKGYSITPGLGIAVNEAEARAYNFLYEPVMLGTYSVP